MKISRVRLGLNIEVVEDAIRQILSQNDTFNSKDIKKKNLIAIIILFYLIPQYSKIEGYEIFVFSSNLMIQVFKSLNGS